MAAQTSQKLAGVISCHSWSPDGSRLALCPNSSEVHLYRAHSDKPWALENVLQQHDRLVSGVDWCPHSNRIVTCSHDLNAYVWTCGADQQWKPDMVITRLKRAALCVRWSPCGRRFAIGGAASEVSVCFTEEAKDWWGAFLIRRHGSAVTGVTWHPDGDTLATICTDGSCRTFHADPADKRKESSRHAAGRVFGELLCEVALDSGWGTAVAWSPSGDQLVFCGQTSQLCFLIAPLAVDREVQRLQAEQLPFCSLVFLAEDLLAAAGFDAEPCLFERRGSGWVPQQRLAGSRRPERAILAERQLASDFSAKLALFKSAGTKVEDKSLSSGAKLHENAIVEVQCLGEARFSTAGLDGRVVIWEV